MRVRLVGAIILAALVAGCTTGEPARRADVARQPANPALAHALVSFDACDDLVDYMIEHALDLVGPWGLGSGPGGFVFSRGLAEVTADEGSAAAEPAPVPDVDFSPTNVQEAGVDEPDTVKTDGRRIFLVRGERLHVIDVTGDAPALMSTTDLGGWGSQLLLSGDRLLVLGTTEGSVRPLGDGVMPWISTGARLALYDVADGANPRRVASAALDGWVVSARLVDGVARVVLRAEPVGLDFVTPEGSGLRAEREATERNREIVRNSTADNWLPYYVRTDERGRETEGALLRCSDVHRPQEFAGLGTTTVLSLSLDDDLALGGSTAVVASSETVYASQERLYVATNRWLDWSALTTREAAEASERFSTELHAFDISDPSRAAYLGSGSVRGHVLNQWAMSDHAGVLRVATTEGSPWWGLRDGVSEPASESFVTTFGLRNGELVQLGQVGGLGLDERIYAVRFMGDLGFVVTFREVDPLYTVDLSDPAAPRVLGELKIMGYSAYLHPVGEDLLLGVGQDADERGMTQGLQLSLFDVSDLADPQRIHHVTLADAHSGVEWDHKAFLHWPATGLVVVPVHTWRWIEERETEEVSSGAYGYTMARETGFVEVGRVTHLPDDVRDSTHPRFYDLAWRGQILRSMVIGDRLYTVSDLGVKASDLATLADAAWLDLPQR